MYKNMGIFVLLLLTSCAELQTEFALTNEDIVVIPNPNAFGGPTETSIKDLSLLLTNETKVLLKDQQKTLVKLVENTNKQMMASLKKKEVASITLFFDRGVSSLEYSYSEPDRLVAFIDDIIRQSRGRKIWIVCIGSATDAQNQDSNIQLAVERAKAPLMLIEKYLVNSAFKIVSTYAVKNEKEKLLENNDKYQNVQIIIAFNKNNLPRLP